MAGVEGIQAPGAGASGPSDGSRRPGEAPPRRPGEPGAKLERGSDGLELSPEAKRRLAELKATDARVRAHEAAHLAAAGGLAKGGASFTYEAGPDGRQYATGGEVSIDTGGVEGDPRATLAKAQQIQRAALAPGDPSPQDRAVAAAAASLAAKASKELGQQSQEGAFAKGGEGSKGLALDVTA